MRAFRRLVGWAVAAVILLAIGLFLYSFARDRPQDLPWTELDLAQPVGMFTRGKLNALSGDFDQCQALLARAGVEYDALEPVSSGPQCGYDNAVRFAPGGARRIGFSPGDLGVACPIAASLAMWEWNILQPAAQRHFGTGIARIEHFGSYSCRRLYGRDAGAWSEHASANAVDIAGFVLNDGQRVTVVGDWNNGDAKSAFLRDVRDGACDLFSTVLSPDYNAAHADHFHFDHARRGRMGMGACR